MKIAILANSISQKGAGISYFVNGISKHLKIKHDVQVFSLRDSLSETDNNINNYYNKSFLNGFGIGYSKQIKKYLIKNINSYNLIHTNSIWGYTHYLGYYLSKRFKIKRVSTVHGMLAPVELNRGKLKKILFRKLFVLNSLNSADCVHVTSILEYSILRSYGVKSPIAVIPIGMELDFDQISSDGINIYEKWPHLANKRILLYLSRVHPIKSVINLVEAWGMLYKAHPDWHLVIAGTGDEKYLNELTKNLFHSGADASTTFLGALYNDDKKNLFKHCDLFVLPTKTENFGIVVLEALMFNKPVITTTGAPWKDLEDYKCGWWIEHGVQPLYNCLSDVLSLTPDELFKIGLNGKTLVKENYSWEKVTDMMQTLYKWQIGGGQIPEFVHFD
jgi:glycosyltransferase involved in cell wall biosynthesis